MVQAHVYGAGDIPVHAPQVLLDHALALTGAQMPLVKTDVLCRIFVGCSSLSHPIPSQWLLSFLDELGRR